MTTYAKITDFASKDALLTGNPAKIVKGVEIDDEFNAIATADATSVKGPIGVTVDNTVVRWDGTTGRAVQGSGVTISDADVVTASGFTGPHNGTVGATTPSTGAFTTLSASGKVSASTSAGTGGFNIGRRDNGSSVFEMYSSAGNWQLFSASAAADVMTYTPGTGLAVTGALSATVADTAFAQKLAGATTKFRFRPYVDATNGAILDVSNAAENAYGVLSIIGSTIRLATGSGTLAATLDSAGNLGLGVTPSAWYTSFSTKAVQVGASAALVGLDVSGSDRRTYLTNNSFLNAGGTPTYINTSAATQYLQVNGAHQWSTAPSGTAGNAITFTQAMTLDASGNLLVGTTSPLASGNHSIYKTNNALTIGVNSTAASTQINFANNVGATVVGSITTNGSATAYNTSSDHRLKHNVRPADAAHFMDIEFVDFEWTIDGRHDCGVIAHQLQSVYPDLVIGEKDATEVRTVEITPAVPEVKDEEGNVVTEAVPAVTEEQTFPVYQQVNYIGLIGRMGTRIQQLQRTVDLMEARLAALEAA